MNTFYFATGMRRVNDLLMRTLLALLLNDCLANHISKELILIRKV